MRHSTAAFLLQKPDALMPASPHVDHVHPRGGNMSDLSQDLAEEFAGKAEIIHKLKSESAHFRTLLERNHVLWKEIQQIQKGIRPAEDEAWERLEKERLAVLDEIALAVETAEG